MTARRYILLVVTICAVLTGCASVGGSSTAGSGKRATLAATATPTLPSIPTPGPLPHDCPVTPPPRQTISDMLAPVTGSSPVWATWAPGPSVFEVLPSTSPNPSVYIAPFGWPITKVIWEVEPNYTHAVTLRGHEVTDNTPLEFQLGGNTPTTQAMLDPEHPGHPKSVIGPGWAEWGSYIIVPKSGCYTMDVSWPTGHWDVTFAAGAPSGTS